MNCYYCGDHINDEGEVASLWVGGHRYCTQACYEAYTKEMDRREQMDRFIDAMGGDQGALPWAEPWEDWEEREREEDWKYREHDNEST